MFALRQIDRVQNKLNQSGITEQKQSMKSLNASNPQNGCGRVGAQSSPVQESSSPPKHGGAESKPDPKGKRERLPAQEASSPPKHGGAEQATSSNFGYLNMSFF